MRLDYFVATAVSNAPALTDTPTVFVAVVYVPTTKYQVPVEILPKVSLQHRNCCC
jgi:hypothetical protein